MSMSLWTGRWRGGLPLGESHRRAREVITPSGGIMRGKFPSRKNARPVHHEGLLELDAIYHFEASPAIACYTEQPQTFAYADGARLRRYTPDFLLLLANGEPAWIEVKPAQALLKEEVAHKLTCVAAHMARRGRRFVVLTEAALKVEPRRSNLMTIFHRAARVPPTMAAARAGLARCAEELPASLRNASTVLGRWGLDPYSLILLGLLRCDLAEAITDDTEITANLENHDGWFWLAQEHGF
jgi:hypothetical protein